MIGPTHDHPNPPGKNPASGSIPRAVYSRLRNVVPCSRHRFPSSVFPVPRIFGNGTAIANSRKALSELRRRLSMADVGATSRRHAHRSDGSTVPMGCEPSVVPLSSPSSPTVPVLVPDWVWADPKYREPLPPPRIGARQSGRGWLRSTSPHGELRQPSGGSSDHQNRTVHACVIG